MKTKLEIIEETVEYYTTDPTRRSFILDKKEWQAYTCAYLLPDGRMCAVGRCMIKPSLTENWAVDGIPDIQDKLKEEYRGHNTHFWKRLQGFHDKRENWNEEGLTIMGKTYVEILKRNFA